MFRIDKTSLAIAIILTVIITIVGSNVEINKANGEAWPARNASASVAGWWKVQSIDTMKYSRDLAREKLKDASFDKTIEEQVKHIAELGATHVAIGTPYDEEFIPILMRWVKYARANGLKVWFRGNFSGWEEWFDYEGITREEHLAKLEEFILGNPDLFEDGDLFSTCPECENGGPGDPRHNGDAAGHKEFLIEEYELATGLFNQIGKNVDARYFSMNGDVAELIYDKETTKALGGLVVVDHYVSSPEILAADVARYRELSGGKVVLGEFGVPIPDIHGELSEVEQAEWLKEALALLSDDEHLVGLNYWVLTGGSTGLWQNGSKREAAETLKLFYNPKKISIKVTNPLGLGVSGAKVRVLHKEFTTDSFGNVDIISPPQVSEVDISKEGYKSYTQSIDDFSNKGSVSLESERENIFLKIINFIRSLLA